MTDSESSDEPGAYTIDDGWETDTTSGSGNVSSSSQSSDDATTNGIMINSVSSSVRGTYTIDDELKIETMSGSVDITVKVDLSTTSRSSPVTIAINTMSGGIKVKGQLTSTTLQSPHRPCTINLHTMSGSIAADLPIGTSTTIRSMSDKINASLHPINPMIPSDINLRNISGRIELDVYPSILEPSAPLRLLSSRVESASGNARLIYPSNWEGKIEGKVGRSGTIKSYWPGILVARGGCQISATKGNGAGKLYISGASTAVELFGKDYGTDCRKGREIESQEMEMADNDSQIGHTAQKRKRRETESQEVEIESHPVQKRKRHEAKGQSIRDDGHRAQKRKRPKNESQELENESHPVQKRKRYGMKSQEMQTTLPLRQR